MSTTNDDSLTSDATATEAAPEVAKTHENAPAPSDDAPAVSSETTEAVAATDGAEDAPMVPANGEAAAPVMDAEEAAGGDEATAEAAPAEPAPDPERLAADAARIRALFSVGDAGAEGGASEDAAPQFRLARWSRPILPALYGVDPGSADAAYAAIAEACAVAGASISDPQADEAGEPNLLIYVCKEWDELRAAPGLAGLEPELDAVIAGLAASDANQHRFFKLSRSEGIVLAVALLRLDGRMTAVSAQAAILGQAARGLALWSDAALASENPIALRRSGKAALKGWFARLLAAIYAPGAPVFSEDPALADTLAEAIGTQTGAAPAKIENGEESSDGKRKRKRRRRRGDKADDTPARNNAPDAGEQAADGEEAGEVASPSDRADSEKPEAAAETSAAEPMSAPTEAAAPTPDGASAAGEDGAAEPRA
ncbi:MAG: hypothetical protein MRY74_02350 [Neomegalonema sp.]|nr:hypothetical protein [Neomegalonema sp.]